MYWIDKMMTVTHIDAARTTNLPPLDQANVLRLWWEDASDPAARRPRTRDDQPTRSSPGEALAAGRPLGRVCLSSGQIWTNGSPAQSPARASSPPTTVGRNARRR